MEGNEINNTNELENEDKDLQKSMDENLASMNALMKSKESYFKEERSWNFFIYMDDINFFYFHLFFYKFKS